MVLALRKLKDGQPYFRPAEVEAQLSQLEALGRDEIARRLPIRDRASAEWLRPETVLHLLRGTRRDNDDAFFELLFRTLRGRVLAALPAVERHGAARADVVSALVDVRDHVTSRFLDMLCMDRESYDERLDFFEIRFDSAIASMRATAWRKIGGDASRLQPLSYDDDNAPTKDVEDALARAAEPASSAIEAADDRSRLLAAISLLPEDQRKVVVMKMEGLPIESKDPDAPSMVKALGCAEKTVRLRLERAYKAMRPALTAELRP